MGTLLFLLFFFWLIYIVLRPVIRAWRAYSKMKSGNFDIFSDLFGQPGAQHTSNADNSSRRGGWTMPRRRKRKKITKEMGEYVKFSDVAASAQTSSSSETESYTATEQQVVDVEWEDI